MRPSLTMDRVTSTLLLLILTTEFASCGTRTELAGQYLPTLTLLQNYSNAKYQESTQEYDILAAQITSNQDRAKTTTQTEIEGVKQALATAKSTPNVSAGTVACLQHQEVEMQKLSVAQLEACDSAKNISELAIVKSQFTILSNVSENAIYWCGTLNPLATENDSFEKCLADKITDLNRQINIVHYEFNKLSNVTLDSNVKCLTNYAGDILSQISLITYEINDIQDWIAKDLIKEYQTALDGLKTKLTSLHRMTNDRILGVKSLVLKSITKARTSSLNQIQTARNVLNQMKLDTAKSSLKIRSCVTTQGVEVLKLKTPSFKSCSGNFSELAKGLLEVSKLQKVLLEVVPLCQRLHPFCKSLSALRLCLAEKVKDIGLQHLGLERRLDGMVQEVWQESTDCIVRENGSSYEEIGEVVGKINGCKFF